MAERKRNRIDEFIDRLKKRLKREPESPSPEDPYAYVGAPKKPRPPARSGAEAVKIER